MLLRWLPHAFTVCQVAEYSKVRLDAPYCFLGKTAEENSLVCLTEDVPPNTICREDGWCGFSIDGVLDFSLIGILSKIASVLAEARVGIFAVSTYNTDYIFLKSAQAQAAKQALRTAGYEIAE